jgi:hypothetical protein
MIDKYMFTNHLEKKALVASLESSKNQRVFILSIGVENL